MDAKLNRQISTMSSDSSTDIISWAFTPQEEVRANPTLSAKLELNGDKNRIVLCKEEGSSYELLMKKLCKKAGKEDIKDLGDIICKIKPKGLSDVASIISLTLLKNNNRKQEISVTELTLAAVDSTLVIKSIYAQVGEKIVEVYNEKKFLEKLSK